jgi:hypothetical protein
LDFGIACQSFLFAGGTVSNTIPGEAHMARGIAMTTDTCRQPGGGGGFRTRAVDKEQLKDSVGPDRRFPFGLPIPL